MTDWAGLLRQCFVARYVLRQHSWHVGVPLKQCEVCQIPAWQNDLRHFIRGQTRSYKFSAIPFPWMRYRMALQRRWRDASKPGTSRVQPRSSDVVLEDSADERSFLCRAIAHAQCLEAQIFDPDFELLLVQYLRVKTAVFRLLVHAPGEHGLERFLTHFSQIKIYAPDAGSLRPQPRKEPGLSVAATEYRVATDAWLKHHRRFIRAIEEGISHKHSGEIAWLIHLKREKHRVDDLPLFGTIVRRLESDGDRIARAIESVPTVLRDLRGLDVAGVERHQPLWVSAETLRGLRRRSQRVAACSIKRDISPLRLTLHVGEEFEWLTSGIRAVAEPIQWDLLLRGDRLGHAIAITVDPLQWWDRRCGRVIEGERFQRLLDLAFLAEYTNKRSDERQQRTVDEIAWLAAEMRPIVSAIWGGSAGEEIDSGLVSRVCELWKILGSKTLRVLMSERNAHPTSIPEKWIYRYLWSDSIQERAHEIVRLKIERSSEINLLIRARRRIIRELVLRQICIESNPTSNLVVAGLDSLVAQSLLHRRFAANKESSEGESPEDRPTWTISTDDPITFSTTLADEYAYAWAGMVLENEKPCEPSDARALLDEAAATSMRMRFTIARN